MTHERNSSQSATLVVAASDSLHKERADYICDGVDDQEKIQAAIDECDINSQDPLVINEKYLFNLCIRIIDDPNTLFMRLLNGGVDLNELVADEDDQEDAK